MMPNLKSTGGRPGITDCMVEFALMDIKNGPWILEKGYCYIYLPDEGRFEQIFIFDGLNVGSTFSDEDECDTCYDKVSREITAYRDVETGQFLNSWNNTLTGELNEVRVSKDILCYNVSDIVFTILHPRKSDQY